ncbi:MAG: alpha/beta hydrolase [Hylemonella sp.]|uniref:alpha/beta fold hydrolase n=1 Tax=Hylemonella sp. TaxID=2066020 RepID=UPI0022BD3129|nr:alpha/beta hydrolase [Hylemonella sp.]MCZ8251147.1 alpha/beta hydrolase [Hylemonella sp.]
MYQARRPARSEFAPVRHLQYHVLRWGAAQSALPPLVLMHGWMDVAASYQFVVDAFSPDFFEGRTILAADWRGFGLTECPGHDNYWFPDYLADLDFLLDHYVGDQAIDLVGHSMGGNVVMLYAGVRPQRIRRLVNLEGFGMPATRSDKAPKRYAQWMDELKSLHRGELSLKAYADADGVARRLMKTNPRLPEDKAQWLARQWARPNAQGQWEILGDAAHKIVNAQLYRVDEVLAAFAAITAPVLSVEASDNQMEQWWQGKYTLAEFHERLKSVPQLQQAKIQDAGHMLHHDQPEQLAALIEKFLA